MRNEILRGSSCLCSLLKDLALATKHAVLQHPSPAALHTHTHTHTHTQRWPLWEPAGHVEMVLGLLRKQPRGAAHPLAPYPDQLLCPSQPSTA